jgi:DNA-binding GntR family transcriptional regulator
MIDFWSNNNGERMAARTPVRRGAADTRAKAQPVRAAAPASLPEPKAKLTDLAYEMLEEAIVTLRLPPGAAVSEQQLAEMTGIGRTPIREAIQRLAREHLILVLPQRGLLVAQIDFNKQLKLLETRREIERLVCRSAARRATDAERKRFAELAQEFIRASARNDDVAFIRADREFNELSLSAARNEFAEGAMRMLHGLSRRFWYLHYKQTPDMPEMARLHAAVATAIAKGDVQAAGEALDRLVDNIEAYTKSTVLSDR